MMHRVGGLWVAAALVVSVGCADGEEKGVFCTADVKHMAVLVVNARDEPVGGAEVTAMNLDTGEVRVTLTHESEGWTAVDERIDGGTVRLVAEQAGRTSPAVEVEWTCDECHCYPSDQPITLVLPD